MYSLDATIERVLLQNTAKRRRLIAASGMGHEEETALGEREVEKSGSEGDGEAEAELANQEKRSESPELVERKKKREKSVKFLHQAAIAEGHGGEEIQANGNADGRGEDHEDENPMGTTGGVPKNRVDFPEPREGHDVKAQVHHLNEIEKETHDSARRGGKIVGVAENGRTRDGLSGRGWHDARCARDFERSDEAVSASREGLNESRIGGRIAQCVANLVDGRVNAVIEIDEGIGRP